MEAAQSTLNKPEGVTETQAVVVKREPERDLITWRAPSRPFKRRDRQFYVTTFAIAGIVGLVLFIAEGIMPVILIVALVFLYYILSTVQPDEIEYKVTTKGIKIAGKLIGWQSMTQFWFTNKLDSELMVIGIETIPGRIEIVIGRELKEQLKKEISAYIPFEEAVPSGLEKMTDWVSSKLPGNK